MFTPGVTYSTTIMDFTDLIAKVQKSVHLYVETKCASLTSSALESIVDIDFDSALLLSIIDQVEVPAPQTTQEAQNEAQELQRSLTARAREFCLIMGLSLVADRILDDIRTSLSEYNREDKQFKAHSVNSEVLHSIEKLCIFFDVLVEICTFELLSAAKNGFFSALQTVLDTLLAISPPLIEIFWYYVESRSELITRRLFNNNITQDRIAFLRICNSLTDKCYERKKSGKYDSYCKDTFSDVFHARVRTFLSALLKFDDATGLNKLLLLASRTNNEPNLGNTKTSDGHLLQEVLLFQRILRDPYIFLKNPRLLSSQVDSMARLSNYFLEEESKYAKIHPPRDVFAICKDIPEEKKNPEFIFSPEQYWLSAFIESRSGEEFEKLRTQDEKAAAERFDQSKFRKLLLVQIFLVCSFFCELQESRKLLALERSGNADSARHIIEEKTPEHLAPKFHKIKRDVLRFMRSWNSPLSYVLQHVGHSEEYWWSWLIDGRQKGGSVLIPEGQFESQVTETREKFEKVVPFKTKRYFNSYATPQLSRRMKVETGLDLLVRDREEEKELEESLEQVTKSIEEAQTDAERQELIEQKNILIWKKVKVKRDTEWLSLDLFLATEDLMDPKEEERLRTPKAKLVEMANGGEAYGGKNEFTEKTEITEPNDVAATTTSKAAEVPRSTATDEKEFERNTVNPVDRMGILLVDEELPKTSTGDVSNFLEDEITYDDNLGDTKSENSNSGVGTNLEADSTLEVDEKTENESPHVNEDQSQEQTDNSTESEKRRAEENNQNSKKPRTGN